LTVPNIESELLSCENTYVLVPLDLVRVAESWPGAVVLQEVHRWCRLNATDRNKVHTHVHDGRWWMYRTQEDWADTLAVSASTTQRTLKQLQKSQMLLIGTFNKKAYDRTRWYAIDYSVVAKRLRLYQSEKPVRRERAERNPLDFGPFRAKLPGPRRKED
jgi:hypothetical protein